MDSKGAFKNVDAVLYSFKRKEHQKNRKAKADVSEKWEVSCTVTGGAVSGLEGLVGHSKICQKDSVTQGVLLTLRQSVQQISQLATFNSEKGVRLKPARFTTHSVIFSLRQAESRSQDDYNVDFTES